MFYSVNGEYYWTYGFYQSVNVGYSVGWGFPGDVNTAGIWFSIIYVMMGVVAVSGIIGIFTEGIIQGRKHWVTKALQRQKDDANSNSSVTFNKIKSCFLENYSSFTAIIAWFLWVIVGVLWSLFTIKWSFSEAVYFAVSSLSTGGLWPIPAGSSSEKYGFGKYMSRK